MGVEKREGNVPNLLVSVEGKGRKGKQAREAQQDCDALLVEIPGLITDNGVTPKHRTRSRPQYSQVCVGSSNKNKHSFRYQLNKPLFLLSAPREIPFYLKLFMIEMSCTSHWKHADISSLIIVDNWVQLPGLDLVRFLNQNPGGLQSDFFHDPCKCTVFSVKSRLIEIHRDLS